MPPIVSIVGRGKVGKTTFLEKLIAELARRGYRVATVKHTEQTVSFDQPGKDTARHIEAGGKLTVLAAPNETALIKPGPLTFDEIRRLVGEDYDLILTEGFKHEKAPKIEVHRREAGEAIGRQLEGLIAAVTDEPLNAGVREFGLEDAPGVADFLEKEIMKKDTGGLALYVNGLPVPLSAFPKHIVQNILVGMATSLKGVDEVKSIDISLRRGVSPAAE